MYSKIMVELNGACHLGVLWGPAVATGSGGLPRVSFTCTHILDVNTAHLDYDLLLYRLCHQKCCGSSSHKEKESY